MTKLATFIMAFVIAGTSLAYAGNCRSDRRVTQQRERAVTVIRPDNWPVGQDRYPRTAQERFLNDYHYCDVGFRCGGGE